MKLSRKLVAALTAGVMAFTLFGMAGCSSSESNTPTESTTEEINAQDLEVTGVGYTTLGDVDEYGAQTVSYAFTVENPNEGYVANSVTFTIEGYDADGVQVVGGGETIQEVYPGITTAAAGTSTLSNADATIERFEVKPLMENILWTKTTESAEELNDTFQLSDTQVKAEDGSMIITGSISAEMAGDDENGGSALDNRMDAHVVAILRDADGNIICGGSAMGIMLDPSMTPINTSAGTGVVPGSVDEDGNPIEPDDAELVSGESGEPVDTGVEGESNLATTTYTITIPGIVNYATVDVYATPGM